MLGHRIKEKSEEKAFIKWVVWSPHMKKPQTFDEFIKKEPEFASDKKTKEEILNIANKIRDKHKASKGGEL